LLLSSARVSSETVFSTVRLTFSSSRRSSVFTIDAGFPPDEDISDRILSHRSSPRKFFFTNSPNEGLVTVFINDTGDKTN